MKMCLLIFVILLGNFVISPQTKKPIEKPTAKPTPKVISPITEAEATTKDGKKVILKSDKTWEFGKEETATISEPAVNEPVSSGYLTVPFEINLTKLPKNFMGHEFHSVYEGTMGTRPFRSEFETTEAYLQKVATKQALDRESTFAIFPRKPYLAYDLSYDADSKQFKVEIKFEDKNLFLIRSYRRIVDFDYIFGSNIHIGMLVSNGEKLDAPLLFNVEAERAKLIKEKATILFVFSLSTPYAYPLEDKEFSYSIGRASIARVLLVGNVTGLWLVNQQTGEIYQKLDLTK